MVNINLKTGETHSSDKIKFGKVLPLMVALFVLVLIIYVVILFISKRTDNEIAAAQSSYDQKFNELKAGNARSVLDFQNRLNQSNKIIDDSVNSRDSLQEIERLMVANVVIEKYDLSADREKITIQCSSTNYDDIAKQIFSFKKSAYFSNVVAGETVFTGKDGKINFEVTLNIK